MPSRVLVAQTDPRLRRLYQRLLATCGHVVETAAGETECVARLLASRPDLLLLDQRCCPDADTDVFAARGGATPVIVTVPSGERVNWPLLTAPDVVDFLYTPAAPSELLASVRAALAGHVVIGEKVKVTRGDCWAVYGLLPSSDAPVRPTPAPAPTDVGPPVPIAFPRVGGAPRRGRSAISLTGG